MKGEDNLQIQVATYIQYQYSFAVFTHVPNGGKRNIKEAVKLKRMGVSSGVPDILIFNKVPFISNSSTMDFNFYSGLAIELKYGKNKVSDRQEGWLSDLHQNGWKVKVCRSFEQAKNEIDIYFSVINN